MTRRESRRQREAKEAQLHEELPPRKRGRPKRYTDEQLEAIEEEKVNQLKLQKKDTIDFFTGFKPSESLNEDLPG